MRLKHLIVYTLFLCPLSALATTAVTGHITRLDTTTPGVTAYVRFWLRGTRGNQPRITGTGAIAPQFSGSTFYVDLPADASGNISGTIYSTRDSTGIGAGDIEAGGSYTAVYYGMQIVNGGIPGPEIPVHARSGGTLDIANVSAVSTLPVVTAPTGDTTYARTDGGNQPFTAAIQAPKVNSVIYVGSVYANITAAAAACPAYTGAAGNSCTVVVPSTIACGEPSQLADNIILQDYRNCSQSQGLRFNLSAAVTGNVRSKMYLQDNYDAGTIGLNPSKGAATGYFNLYVDHPEQTSGTLEAINGTANVNSYSADMASGHIIGIEGSAQASVSGTTHNIADLRGGTFNTTIGGNTTVTQMASLYAQTPVLLSAATATRQYAFIAEDVTGSSSSDDASIWAKGRTRVDGPLSIRGNTFLPAATATNFWMAGGYGSPIIGKIFVGDGTTWELDFAKRSGGTDTTFWKFKDTGQILGQAGTSFGYSNSASFATAPTISSGFGTSPSVVRSNGTLAFTINVGTGGTATNGVIGLPTAANGWDVKCTDITTNSATVFLTKQTATSTTTATVGNFNTSAVAAAWVASDVLSCQAAAY